MMFLKIYTRKAWLSYFNCYPCIVIDDKGEIYDGNEYYRRLIRYPIGYIKNGSGGVREIYGEEYRTKMFCYPIGYLVDGRGNVQELYGPDFRTKIIRYPVGYIKDDKYYTYDEFHRFFSYPSYYIERS